MSQLPVAGGQWSDEEIAELLEIGRQGERLALIHKYGEEKADEILLERELGTLTYEMEEIDL